MTFRALGPSGQRVPGSTQQGLFKVADAEDVTAAEAEAARRRDGLEVERAFDSSRAQLDAIEARMTAAEKTLAAVLGHLEATGVKGFMYFRLTNGVVTAQGGYGLSVGAIGTTVAIQLDEPFADEKYFKSATNESGTSHVLVIANETASQFVITKYNTTTGVATALNVGVHDISVCVAGRRSLGI